MVTNKKESKMSLVLSFKLVDPVFKPFITSSHVITKSSVILFKSEGFT